MKRVLSWLLVLVMVFSMLPLAAFAEEATILYSQQNLALTAEQNQYGETIAVPHEASVTVPANGTVTVSITSADPGVQYWFGDNLPQTKTATFENVAAGTYTFTIKGYHNWADAAATVSFTISFAASEGDSGEVEKKEYVVSSQVLNLESNTLVLDSAAVTTIYAFEPTQTGVYSFTADNGAVVGYWGAGTYLLTNPGSTGSSCEWTCSGVGQSAYIGVSGVESCNMNVARTGDYESNEINYKKYENEHTPDSAIMGCVTVADTDANAQVVNFKHSTISISTMLGYGAARYVEKDEDGNVVVAYDYTDALTAYVNASVNGYYVLTPDLEQMLAHLYVSKGWSDYLTSWTDLCKNAVVNHTAGDAVEEEGYSNVYCTACETLITSEKLSVEGDSAENPIYPEWAWNENGSEATATVTLGTGTWYFATYRLNGTLEMTANGEKVVYTPAPDMMSAATWTIVNDGEETTYELKLATPVGEMSNPEVISELFYSYFNVSLAEGDNDGHYYIYNAEGDGQITLYINSITEGAEGDIVVTNRNNYQQRTLLADGVDNYGLELVVEVSEGDELLIQVLVVPGDNWAIPAADIEWFGTFAAKQGSEANPYNIYDENYETEAVIEYTAQATAGETTYFQGYGLADTTLVFSAENVIVTVDGEPVTSGYVIPASANPRMPTAITITNNGDEAASIDLEFTYAAGSSMNPAELVIGENVVELAEGNTGYYFTWTAAEDTELTVAVSGSSWMYNVNKTPVDPEDYAGYVYGDPHWHNDEPVVASETIAVKAGEVVDVFVQTYDPADEFGGKPLPAGTITVTASLPAEEETPVVAGPFKFYVEQGNLNKILYVTGAMSGYYGATSEVAAEGKDFYTETTSQGTRIYYLDGETKIYADIIASGTFLNVSFTEEPTAYFTYNAEYDTYVTTVNDTECYFGSYNNYNTLSASKFSYISTSFPAHLCDPDNLPEVPVEPEKPEDPEADSELTIEEAIALGESKNHNTYTEGKYYVTGTIKEVYSEKYGNMYVVDEAGNQLTIYGSYDYTGETGYADMGMKPVAGDTVVLYGKIGQYNGTAQMKNAWIVDFQCGHELTHVDAIEPGCHYDGVQEHWFCTKCGGFWTDEACTQLTNRFNVVVPATGEGQVAHMDAVEPGCHDAGCVEHWICYTCEKVALDEAFTQLTNILSVRLPATGEGLVAHMDAVEPGCHDAGCVEHWICYTCEKVALDEAFTQLTNILSVRLPATGEGLVVHNEAVEPGCHDTGCVEHWICYTCEKVALDEAFTQLTNILSVRLPATGEGLVVHNEAAEPGCHYNGQVEHWICYTCEKVALDEAFTQLTNIKNVVLPYTNEPEAIHVEAKDPTCFEEGNIEHWYCEECGQVWTDAALTQLSNHMNVKLGITHTNLVHMEAVEPGCHYNGNIEYWVCYDCGGHWTDELCRFNTNAMSVVLPMTNEGQVAHIEAAEPGCHYDGNIEYWICYTCEQVWQDEALTQLTNIKNVVLPATGEGEIVHVEAVEPGCENEGNIEHWYCKDCDKVWTDEALTQLTNHMNVKLGITHTNLVHMERVEPGCHYNGNIEYWVCYDCGGHWTDELCRFNTNAMSVVLPMTNEGHVVHVEAAEPTCQNGNIEYWYCEDCEQVWQNEELTQLTNFRNVIVPATGEHDVDMDKLVWKWTTDKDGNKTAAVAYGYCASCEAQIVWEATVSSNRTEYKDEKYKDYDAVTIIDTYTAVVVVDGEVYTAKCLVVHATCFGQGYTEYFGRVERYGKVYDYGTKGSGNVLERTAKLAHVVVENKDGEKFCRVCGTVNPSTGDMIMISVVVMILAGAAVVILLSKKRRMV